MSAGGGEQGEGSRGRGAHFPGVFLLHLLSLPPTPSSSLVTPGHVWEAPGKCTCIVPLSRLRAPCPGQQAPRCLCSGADKHWHVELSRVVQVGSPLPDILLDLEQPSRTGILPGPVLGPGGQRVEREGGDAPLPQCLPFQGPLMLLEVSGW